MAAELVATVAALYRFPVKSMQGESLASARLGWHGLDGDRRYAFVKTGDLSNFPWLTARDLPALVRYQACVSDPADACGSAVRVRAPSGAEHEVTSPDLLDELRSTFAPGSASRFDRVFQPLLDVPLPTVKTRLFRARQVLKRALEDWQ